MLRRYKGIQEANSAAMVPLVSYDSIGTPISEDGGFVRQRQASKKHGPNRADQTRGPSASKSSPNKKMRATCLDMLLIAVSLLFLILAFAAIALNNQSVGSQVGLVAEQATTLGPTTFPIVFGALVSRALRNIGRHKVEGGVKLGALWQVMNSRTIFDTVWNAFQLHQFTFLSAYLVLFWSLSPLGGQASLRILYKFNDTSTTTMPLRYLDHGPLSQLYTAIWAQQLDQGSYYILPPGFNAALDAAFFQDSTKKSGWRDTWGNLKVPRLESVANSTKGPEGWYELCHPDCTHTMSPESYSSLVGVPVVGLPPEGRTQFSIETSYLSLECSAFQPIDDSDNPSSSVLNITCPGCLNPVAINPYSTIRVGEFLAVPGYAGYQQSNITSGFAQTLIVRQRQAFKISEGIKSSEASCLAFQQLVETAFDCSFGNCTAIRTRPSVTDHRSKNLTIFDYWGRSALGYVAAFSHTETWGLPLSVELFIKDPAALPLFPLQENFSPDGSDGPTPAVNFAQFAPQEFSVRLALLLNTVTQIFMTLGQIGVDLPSNLSLYGPDHTPAQGTSYISNFLPAQLQSPISILGPIKDIVGTPTFIGASTNATYTQYRMIYKANVAWVVILLISSGLLIGIGIVSMWQLYTVRAPDIFDPVMAFTYDNRYIDTAEDYGSTLDAVKRARLLSGLEVQLGDVDARWGVGKVALGTKGRVERLVDGRLYE